MAELIIIAVLALILGLGASSVVLCFHETWDYNFINNNHNRKFTVVTYVWSVMEAISQPSLVLAGRVQTCQETLFMSPVGIVCQLRDNRMVPKCEVYLTLKNEMRSCITENTK